VQTTSRSFAATCATAAARYGQPLVVVVEEGEQRAAR
jgi:hypothetical protein